MTASARGLVIEPTCAKLTEIAWKPSVDRLIVSLRNRTAERRGRQYARVWQRWRGYYLRVLSWSSLNINVFWSFLKKICLKESEVWRKVISNKIIVTLVTEGFPSVSLSCCVSSLNIERAPLKNVLSRSSALFRHCLWDRHFSRRRTLSTGLKCVLLKESCLQK